MSQLPPFSVPDTVDVGFQLHPHDAGGQPTVDANLVWASSDEAVLKIPAPETFPDGSQGYRGVTGAPGVAVISVTDDAGIADKVEITVTAGPTTDLGLTVVQLAKV